MNPQRPLIEPDQGDGPFHRKVLRYLPVAGWRSRNRLTLECGHRVDSFGDLAHLKAQGGRVFCETCWLAAQEKPDA